MIENELQALAVLPPHERQALIDESIETLVPLIDATDIEEATAQVRPFVAEWQGEGEHGDNGFVVITMQRENAYTVLGESDEPNIHWLQDVARGNSLVTIAVDVLPDEHTIVHTKAAIDRLLITAQTGAPSGSIDSDFLQDHNFKPSYGLNENVPGAIMVGDLIVSVAGLHPDNCRSAAEAIALYALESAESRHDGDSVVSKSDFERLVDVSGAGMLWTVLTRLVEMQPEFPLSKLEERNPDRYLAGNIADAITWIKQNRPKSTRLLSLLNQILESKQRTQTS